MTLRRLGRQRTFRVLDGGRSDSGRPAALAAVGNRHPADASEREFGPRILLGIAAASAAAAMPVGARPPTPAPPDVSPTTVTVTLPRHVLDDIDLAARREGRTRDVWLAEAAVEQLELPRAFLTGFAAWLHDELGYDLDEVLRAVEKPWCYADEMAAYRGEMDAGPDPA